MFWQTQMKKFSFESRALGVIHKPRGQIFGYFDPPPASWSLLLNKAYVTKWSFGYPPPPQLYTWFMNVPLQDLQ